MLLSPILKIELIDGRRIVCLPLKDIEYQILSITLLSVRADLVD